MLYPKVLIRIEPPQKSPSCEFETFLTNSHNIWGTGMTLLNGSFRSLKPEAVQKAGVKETNIVISIKKHLLKRKKPI